MRRLLLLAFAPALVAAAPAGPDARLREVEARYAAMAAAFGRADADGIIAMRTADFSAVLPDGVRQDAGYMAEVLRQFFVVNRAPFDVRYTLRCGTFHPDRATLVVFQQAERSQELAGQWRRVASDVTQREHWRRSPSGWQLAAVDSIHAPHRWIDGVPIDPTQAYHPDIAPFAPSTVAGPTCEAVLDGELAAA